MNNENENFVPEIDTSITLPAPDATPAAAEGIEEKAARLSIDATTLAAVKQLLEPVEPTAVTDELLQALAQAVHRDEDVSNAEATGYLRGRNENIAKECGMTPELDDVTLEATFPRYVRRSVWD